MINYAACFCVTRRGMNAHSLSLSLSLYVHIEMHTVMQNISEHGSKVTDNQDAIQYVHCMYTKCITTVAWTSLEELANSDAQYHLIEWAEHNEL